MPLKAIFFLIALFIYSSSGYSTTSIHIISPHNSEDTSQKEKQVIIINHPDSVVLTLKRLSYTQPQKAFDIGERIKQEAQNSKNTILESRAYHEMAFSKTFLGESDLAVSYADTSYLIAKEAKDRIGMLRALNTKAHALYNLDKYTEAMTCLLEALNIKGDTREDSTQIGITYRRIANIHLRSGDPKAMEQDLLKSYDMLKNTKDEILLIGTIGSLAHANRDQGRKDVAKEYYNQVLEIAIRNDLKPHLGTTYAALRGLATEEGDHQKAKELAYLSLNTLREMGDDLTITEQLVNTAYVHITLEEYSDAQRLINEAITLSKKMNHQRSLERVFRVQSHLFEEQGEYDESLEFYKLYKNYSDSVVSRRNVEQYRNLEKQREIDLKEVQLESLKSTQLRQQKERNFALLGISIMVLLGFLLVKRYRTNRKLTDQLYIKNQEIENQKIELAEALDEKNVLLREIHHRVKNNLQIISSLLNLQSKKISDESILQSINEGKNRVQAMSLIHQNLYQSEHLTTVNMNTYLHELTDYLAKSFGAKKKNIIHELDVENIHFDIDTAIPIGLVLNELVTNCYKHAFEGKESGAIKIGLKHRDDGRYELSINDNGKGISSDFDINSSKSLGMKLINSLGVRQLNGELNVFSDHGTHVSLSFNDLANNKSM